MAKKISCELIIGTRTRMISLGNFNSISEAKKYISECNITCYKLIKRN
jgi:hypothetical protein